MWLDNLKELRKSTGMSFKQIAEMTNLPERTIARIFSGDTANPYVDTLHRIVSVLGGSLDTILTDSKAVVGNTNLSTLQNDVDKLNGEVDRLTDEIVRLSTENITLKDNVSKLTVENNMLQLMLEHKDEIISLHNYYNNRK